jgi:hypothetical protein
MYWTWDLNNETYVSWGQPRSVHKKMVDNLKPDFNVPIYSGKSIGKNEKVVFSMQGDATLGLGDSIWLISYIRDIYRIKGRRHCEIHVCSSEDINRFYSNFLPSSMVFREEYITKKEFDSFDHKLPAMYYWKERDQADRSWLDNKSILERLYDVAGMEYNGLPDFGEFTNEEILYPSHNFYERLGLNKQDNYVFFQWHSSGHCKNLPPKTNIKIIKHIIKKYKLKVYVIGRLNSLDSLEMIPGVVNLSNKTQAVDVISLAFNAEFIVSPDSAGIHLGEAYRIPAVGIMATLPPIYIAAKYKIPTFMYGSGYCPYKPCGIVDKLPIKEKCPEGTTHYCAVLQDVDLNLFDHCINRTFANRMAFRNKAPVPFYKSQSLPISLSSPLDAYRIVEYPAENQMNANNCPS